MKKLACSLVIAVVLGMTAPPSAWSANPAGGGVGGHIGGFGRGAGRLGAPGGVEHFGPGRGLHDMHPFDREGQFDHDGRFDRDSHRHGHVRFGYPVCFAYAYCPYPTVPCAWREGYWLQPPTAYDANGFALDGVWIAPGC